MDLSQAFGILSIVFISCWNWFEQIWSYKGAVNYLLGVIFTYLVYRFFLAPLFSGGGSSDKAKKSGKKDK